MPATPSYPARHHPRFSGHDYQTPGFYFVTICVEQRLPLFGSVEGSSMQLTAAGPPYRMYRTIGRVPSHARRP